MTLSFTNQDGSLDWGKMNRVLRDMADGHLSNYEEVDYTFDVGRSDIELLIKQEDDDVELDAVGSQLLNYCSKLHSFSLEAKYDHKEASEEEVIRRAESFAHMTLEISDNYQLGNPTWREHFHGQLVAICNAIIEAHNELDNNREPIDEQ